MIQPKESVFLYSFPGHGGYGGGSRPGYGGGSRPGM